MAHNPASDQRQQALVSGGAPDPRRWQALALVCVAFFMTVLDVSIVTVALPSIASSLHFSQTDLQWVLVAYAITFGGFLLLGGRAGDLLGRRLMFMVGLALFTVASLTCGLAGSAAMLITARAFQGLGAAFISPATLSIITTTFEEGPERNKALGIWGAMGGSGAAAGVLFGGILTNYLGWEWIFFVNVPVGVAVLAATPFRVRESRAPLEARRFDVVGAATVTAGVRRSSTPSPRRPPWAGPAGRRSACWLRPWCCSGFSSSGRRTPALRSCRSRFSGSGRWPAPTPSQAWPARRYLRISTF